LLRLTAAPATDPSAGDATPVFDPVCAAWIHEQSRLLFDRERHMNMSDKLANGVENSRPGKRWLLTISVS
jgi:hypothetical protein